MIERTDCCSSGWFDFLKGLIGVYGKEVDSLSAAEDSALFWLVVGKKIGWRGLGGGGVWITNRRAAGLTFSTDLLQKDLIRNERVVRFALYSTEFELFKEHFKF